MGGIIMVAVLIPIAAVVGTLAIRETLHPTPEQETEQ